MAKGIGLIGNFRGKVGNMVGYNLKDSNNKQTQGVRVYQPIVKNPKTYAQAAQRAKLAPINATYRALKQIIDRGQEGKAYGNKSRLAWLKQALKNFDGPYFVKGSVVEGCPLIVITDGSLQSLESAFTVGSAVTLEVEGLTDLSNRTVGAVSTAIKASYPYIKEGDQLTFVNVGTYQHGVTALFESIVINSSSTESFPNTFNLTSNGLQFANDFESNFAGTVILSREGENGSHLRSKATLHQGADYNPGDNIEEAIRSYMSTGSNTDWAEESLQNG